MQSVIILQMFCYGISVFTNMYGHPCEKRKNDWNEMKLKTELSVVSGVQRGRRHLNTRGAERQKIIDLPGG